MIVDFNNPVPPKDYKCDHCGTTGVRLWFSTSGKELICHSCLESKTEKKVPSRHAEIYGFEIEKAVIAFFPALPKLSEVNCYWPLAIAPQYTLEWWRALPNSLTLNLDEFEATLRKTLALLEDKQPGIASWNMFLHERLVELNRMTAPFCKKAGGK